MIVDADEDWNVQCSGCSVLSPMEVRFNLPVTLTDANTVMRSTIKTPDAEKLSPFTALEIKKLEDEGQSPLHGLTIAIDNTDVVCFVKYYDKMIAGEMVRRYVILKTYTLEEMKVFAPDASTTMEPTSSLESANDASVAAETLPLSPHSNKAAEPERQFFTPTTKQTLEETAKSCAPGESSTSQPSNVKRTISFGTITPEDLGVVPCQLLDSDVQKVTESPKKKNKGQDNQV